MKHLAALDSSMIAVMTASAEPPRLGKVNQLDYLPTVVERLVKGFDPLKIILFGSLARGDAGAWSDMDLLVVMPAGIVRRRISPARALHRGAAVPTFSGVADLPHPLVPGDAGVAWRLARAADFSGTA